MRRPMHQTGHLGSGRSHNGLDVGLLERLIQRIRH